MKEPEVKITLSGFAYKIKDWLVILSALFGMFVWSSKFVEIPKRLDRVEQRQAVMSKEVIEMKSGISYLIKTVDRIAK